MWTDLLLQAAMILTAVFMFLCMQNIPQKYFSALRFRLQRRSNIEAKRHFIQGAQLFSQAKSAMDPSSASSLAKSAEEEADLAIAIDSKDAASHILKALALDLRGLKPAAIESLDAALSRRSSRTLSGEERADALFKRAELRMAVSDSRRFDLAVADLVESVRLKGENVKAFCLLGECYEKMGLIGEAKAAFEDGLKIQPNNSVAQEGLDRMGS